jgi:hypothetical protein
MARRYGIPTDDRTVRITSAYAEACPRLRRQFSSGRSLLLLTGAAQAANEKQSISMN